MVNHEYFIKRAYVLARKAAANGDHPFSVLLVNSGQIVLECLNTLLVRFFQIKGLIYIEISGEGAYNKMSKYVPPAGGLHWTLLRIAD